jgi:hypothetical protein
MQCFYCRAMRNILLISGVLMGLTACERYVPGATATPPAHLTTTACSGAYSTDHYTIQCPEGWIVTSTPTLPDVQSFSSPDHMTGMIISSPVGNLTASQYGVLLRQYMSRANIANVAITLSNKTTTVGPNTWTLMATGTGNKAATNYTYHQYVTYHDGKRYMAVPYAPTSSFASAEKGLLSMLASLRFH